MLYVSCSRWMGLVLLFLDRTGLGLDPPHLTDGLISFMKLP